MDSKLELWKNRGFYPDIIFDIGAHKGTWARMAKNIFGYSSLYLFEASDTNINYNTEPHYFNVLLGSEDKKQVNFYETIGECNTGNSIYKELTNTFCDDNYKIIKKEIRTLDNFTNENNIPYPDFIKIDTQGAELDILKGATNCMKNAKMILLEVSIHQYNKGAPLIADVVNFMNENDFIIIDIVDTHLINSYLVQIDVLFAKKNSEFIKTNFY